MRGHPPTDIACLVGPSGSVPDLGPGRAVAVLFGGTGHDWAALELAARIASAHGAPIRLLGSSDDPMAGDITDLLADVALVVQHPTGMATQPAVVSSGGVVELARDTGLFVVGLSGRWQAEGLGPIHAEIAHAVPAQVLFVRRGTRPGLLTWPPPGRDPAWPTAATVGST